MFASGRVNVITFDKHFKEDERDTDLKDKLKAEDEISGIFNWCLEGLKKFRKEGLKIPKEIEIATAEYRKSNDKIDISLGGACWKCGLRGRMTDGEEETTEGY